MTMEQVVTQLQQELFNLRSPQVRKDTPSLIGVKGLGRPKEFTGREETSNSGRRRRRLSSLV